MTEDDVPRRGALTTRQMVIAFAVLEASVLIPLVIYLAVRN